MSPLPSKIPSHVGSIGSVLLKTKINEISESMNTHKFYLNQEVMKIYESTDTTYNQKYNKQKKTLD